MSRLQGLMKSQVLAGSGLLWDQDHIMAIIRGSSFFATLHWVSRGALCNQACRQVVLEIFQLTQCPELQQDDKKQAMHWPPMSPQTRLCCQSARFDILSRGS